MTITALLRGCAEISCNMDTDSRAQELLHGTELRLRKDTKRRSPWKQRHITFLNTVNVDSLQYEHADMNIPLTERCRKSAENCDI
jgi:hypothetical protein